MMAETTLSSKLATIIHLLHRFPTENWMKTLSVENTWREEPTYLTVYE